MSHSATDVTRPGPVTSAGLGLVLLLTLGLQDAGAQSSGSVRDSWDQEFRHRQFRPVDPAGSFPAYCVGRLMKEGLLSAGKSKVLVLAMGDGPNAIHFARQGLDVTGLDISPVAIATAHKIAASGGVTIKTVEADLFNYDLGEDKWDLVTNIYFNPAIKVFCRMKNSVRPGGFLLVEGYGADYMGSGPPEWCRYRPNELIKLLDGWRILEYQDGYYPNTWTGAKRVAVVRVLAQKPEF